MDGDVDDREDGGQKGEQQQARRQGGGAEAEPRDGERGGERGGEDRRRLRLACQCARATASRAGSRSRGGRGVRLPESAVSPVIGRRTATMTRPERCGDGLRRPAASEAPEDAPPAQAVRLTPIAAVRTSPKRIFIRGTSLGVKNRVDRVS
jgi:hypothetical protein